MVHTGVTTEEKVSFEVVEKITTVSDRGKGTLVRLDYASWNGNQPKYEIRIWKEKDGKSVPTKGIGLSGEELIALGKIIQQLQKK